MKITSFSENKYKKACENDPIYLCKCIIYNYMVYIRIYIKLLIQLFYGQKELITQFFYYCFFY